MTGLDTTVMGHSSVLERIDDNIWLCDGPNVNFYSFPYPTRMVVIRLKSGEIWVWSPIALSSEIEQEINTLGRVAHLVSPNKIHHLALSEWKAAWPDAMIWGPASTIRKRKDLKFQSPLKDKPPAAWCAEIDQVWFRGSIFLDEIVFFHRESRTVIFADLSENFSPQFLKQYWTRTGRIIARLWRIVEGYGYPPLELRATWVRRKKAKRALSKVLSWKPEKVIMAHGVWQRSNGEAYVRRAFAWLSKSA